MNALPLIHRELLVNARKPATRRMRVLIALAALAIAGLFLLAVEHSSTRLGGYPGQALFQILTWLSMGAAGLFGVFFAGDTISEERREGTLGLLFLTPLRGRDVVLGKLTGTLLRTGYGLLAALPIIALPLLIGGVTFYNYFRVSLVLANTLFLSTSMGLMVSAMSRDALQATIGTLLVLLALALIPLVIDSSMVGTTGNYTPWASFLSPAYALYVGSSGRNPEVWYCLPLQQLVAWVGLVVASVRTSRVGESSSVAIRNPARRHKTATHHRRPDSGLRDREPVAWLVQRRSSGPTIIALIALIALVICAIIAAWNNAGNEPVFAYVTAIAGFIHWLFYFVVLVWLALLATRRTGHARAQGELELLLATPVSVREMVTGHWHGLIRVFALPILATASIAILAMIGQFLQMRGQFTATNAQFTTAIATQLLLSSAFGVAGIFTTTAAVIWVGLWNGLKGENLSASATKTFFVVVVAPALGLMALRILGLFTGFLFSGGRMDLYWMSAIFQGCVSLGIDFAFIIWARGKLLANFREAATGSVQTRSPPIRERLVTPVTKSEN